MSHGYVSRAPAPVLLGNKPDDNLKHGLGTQRALSPGDWETRSDDFPLRSGQLKCGVGLCGCSQ